MVWPPVLTARLVSSLRQFDWVVIDVADTVAGVTALAFLHGHAIPMLRLQRQTVPRPRQQSRRHCSAASTSATARTSSDGAPKTT